MSRLPAEQAADRTAPKITREEIEARIEAAKINALANPADAVYHHKTIAAYTLALQALDMEPRPIEDAPKDGATIYGWHRQYRCYIAAEWDGNAWEEVTEGGAWSNAAFTHFLTSLPEPKI